MQETLLLYTRAAIACSKAFIAAVYRFYQRWFHTRSLIIVSEHKVKHLPISGFVQFCVTVMLVTGICWGTYSTDGYFSARATVKAQGQTLRSVASDRIDSTFGSVLKPSALPGRSHQMTDPMLALSSPDPKTLYAHIAKLEQEVTVLKTSNEAIVQRVKEKTSAGIDNLESIIRQTGLNSEELKKQAKRNTPEPAEGGPYIPEEMGNLSHSQAETLFNDLDRLSLLRQIVSNLPLAMPIHSAEEQSPFGRRVDPFTGHLAFHSGLDLSGPVGSEVFSTAAGTVKSAERDGAYGNMIDIDHGFGIVTRYAHLSKILVEAGDHVDAGDAIGIQGSTGRSTGAHLHYEVRYHDQPMDPKNFLPGHHYAVEN